MNQLIGRSFIRSGICFIPLLCWTPASAQTGAEIPFVENVFPEWGLTGSLSLRFDDLIVRGNEANNSFSSQGGQYLGNFDLGISRRFSQYNTLEGQISGALNFSDLRSDSTGFVPERASLTWTYGEGALPLLENELH